MLNVQKNINFTAEMAEDVKAYCRGKGIESESELIRQAVVFYIDRDYGDDTLKLSTLKDLRENIREVKDMIAVLFSYTNFMHQNLLAYHGELDEQDKKAAMTSAERRNDKFFASFRERLRDDPPLFEKLLHKYVAGSLDG